MKVTLQHYHNPDGNLNDRPCLKDTALNTTDDTNIFLWLVLRYAGYQLVDVDDDNNGPARSGDVGIDKEEGGQTAESAETGFVSLATGESISLTTDLHITD